jgi:hypothetical protein
MQPQRPTVRSALALLGLSEGAPRAAVTQAYRRLALTTHPDLSDAADAAARFAALTDAYRRVLAAAPVQAATTSALATEPTTSPAVPRARPRIVHPGVVTLYDRAGASSPIIVVGPARMEPLSARRAREGGPP